MFIRPLCRQPSAVDGGGAVVAEDLVHLVEAELVVAGGNGRVRGEDALLADGVDVGFGGLAQGLAGEALFEQADGRGGRRGPRSCGRPRACSRGRASRATPPRPRTVS